MRQVAIVMYHYVRPIKESKYPRLKGLEIADFEGQLKYFARHFTPITMEELQGSLSSGTDLPQNALLLTFDDGYSDHFDFVLPLLKKNGWQGSFFPPLTTVIEHKVLDVNKIHFILASQDDVEGLVEELFSLIDTYRSDHPLKSNKEYFEQVAIPSRYDSKEIMFIKRMLQKELPGNVRRLVLDELFARFVSKDETSFAKNLYVSVSQLKKMKKEGMFIGGHGYEHRFLSGLTKQEQDQEISASREILRLSGSSVENWVMCYPYGAFDTSFLRALEKKHCSLGLTLKVGIADLDKDRPLELPRLDTNDFPTKADARKNRWAEKMRTT